MAFGVFGKLPQKRDFVALNIPRAVLEPFETWLQSAVAASRNELGTDWQEHYLVAPIWRFWIGADILGVGCAGSLVPSVDKRRPFLPAFDTLLCREWPRHRCPAIRSAGRWYSAIEQRLLGVLEENAEIEVDRLTEGLTPPQSTVTAPAPRPERFKRGAIWQGHGDAPEDMLSGLMPSDYWACLSVRSFWWTRGGSAPGQLVYARNALPDPFFYELC